MPGVPSAIDSKRLNAITGVHNRRIGSNTPDKTQGPDEYQCSETEGFPIAGLEDLPQEECGYETRHECEKTLLPKAIHENALQPPKQTMIFSNSCAQSQI